MYNVSPEDNFDIVDLDPYGSMVPFLHSAMKSLNNGSLLCVTCTDTWVLCGSDWHKCYYLYRSARGGSHTIQDLGIRVVLHTLNLHANTLNK